MIRTALKPKWIALLILVLAIASGFAWLGKWQLERAVLTPDTSKSESEIVRPLTELIEPGVIVNDSAGGHMVSVSAQLVPNSFTIASGRLNQGKPGYWLVARAIVGPAQLTSSSTNASEPVSLAVALGWAETPAEVDLAAATLGATITPDSPMFDITGRFMPSEAPDIPANRADPFSQQTVSVAALINQWPDYSGTAYEGYLVAQQSPQGLTKIDSFAPVDETQVNWLNIFYAIEWAVFALFAVYIWWRMVRDDWQNEQDDAENSAG